MLHEAVDILAYASQCCVSFQRLNGIVVQESVITMVITMLCTQAQAILNVQDQVESM